MFMFRKMLAATTATILLTGPALAAPIDTNRPTFDCSLAKSAIPRILCSSREAAQADWDLNRASWAYYADNPAEADKEAERFNNSLNERCRLPSQLSQDELAGRAMADQFGRLVFGNTFRVPGQQSLTRENVNCVISAFHQRATFLRSKMEGDAFVESNLSPEEHAEFQEALTVRGYTAEADGQFGPTTRLAIKQFQQSIGAYPTGVLSQKQMANLIGMAGPPPQTQSVPEQPQVPQLSPKEQKRQADAEKKRQAKADEDEKKRQADADAEKKRQADADAEKERQRLEKQRQEWRRRFEETQKQGPEYAERSGTRWTLSHTEDEMNDVYSVRSTQSKERSAAVEVTGTCQYSRQAKFLAIVYEIDPQTKRPTGVPLGLPHSDQMTIGGQKKINDEPPSEIRFQNQDGYRNRFLVSSFTRPC